jgi:hypothetical protein
MSLPSLLLEAREIVRAQPATNLYALHLKKCADELQEAYDILKVSCTREAATDFIARFNRTLLAIERVHEHCPPTPTGGKMPVEKPREQTGQPAAL